MPVLVIQRGHCYRKTGATGTTGEQAYASSVANACVNLLHGRDGWTVRAILADDPTSKYAGDAFVAIHCDGSTSSSARGASVGYRNAAGQTFGQAWKRAYAARGWTGGFRPDNYTDALHLYYGTGNALSVGNTRAFIAECGFMTNTQDRALLTATGGPTRVALAIGDALGITATSPPQENDVELSTVIKDGSYQETVGHTLANIAQNAKAAREYVDTLEKKLGDVQADVAAVRSKLDSLAVGGGTVDYPTLASQLADELDRRARDGNPNTGPQS